MLGTVFTQEIYVRVACARLLAFMFISLFLFRYHLLVEGYGLAAVMGAPGIDGTRTRSNHIIEVRRWFCSGLTK